MATRSLLKLNRSKIIVSTFFSEHNQRLFLNNKEVRSGCIGQEAQTRWLNIKKEDKDGRGVMNLLRQHTQAPDNIIRNIALGVMRYTAVNDQITHSQPQRVSLFATWRNKNRAELRVCKCAA
jgi:hypothetical protein